MSNPRISLIIPIYNEEALIEPLLERSIHVLNNITDNFEIIAVDDGSTDNSLRTLREWHDKDNRMKVLVLSRNFGHQAAYTAGLNYAKGDCIAMMDGDLQDPPESLKDMYDRLMATDCDIVSAKRIHRKEKFTRRLLAKSFHFVFARLSAMQRLVDVGNFSLFNRKALSAMLSFQEKHRYLPGLRSLIGFNHEYVEYARQDRPTGKSRMTARMLFRLAFDAFFSFSDLPIKACMWTGLFGVVLFLMAAFYILISKAAGFAPLGWSSTLLSIYFLASVQLLFLGIIGEYISRIYRETQNRPIFIVQEYID
jgi:dolichol-phosphate mannosyltransferase